ncbi:hypothetical protein AG1IA_06425 [Rhizoctonia solani AG-1 IA]|uniref:Uncharacterized protein n=1 Tax=Thanatephorus cucumeris (strain AG1-IA) TaxID=983506 RepID=L8WNI5_THACA|nr:hypothetical protein AG1IA_06425 [Rhizoctonia solani AG-1 IA]
MSAQLVATPICIGYPTKTQAYFLHQRVEIYLALLWPSARAMRRTPDTCEDSLNLQQTRYFHQSLVFRKPFTYHPGAWAGSQMWPMKLSWFYAERKWSEDHGEGYIDKYSAQSALIHSLAATHTSPLIDWKFSI